MFKNIFSTCSCMISYHGLCNELTPSPNASLVLHNTLSGNNPLSNDFLNKIFTFFDLQWLRISGGIFKYVEMKFTSKGVLASNHVMIYFYQNAIHQNSVFHSIISILYQMIYYLCMMKINISTAYSPNSSLKTTLQSLISLFRYNQLSTLLYSCCIITTNIIYCLQRRKKIIIIYNNFMMVSIQMISY